MGVVFLKGVERGVGGRGGRSRGSHFGIRQERDLRGMSGRVPAPALRVRLPLPSRAGRGWCVPSSQEFEIGRVPGWGGGEWRRWWQAAPASSSAVASATAGRSSRERSTECQPAATTQNWELGTRAPDLPPRPLPPPPPPRAGGAGAREPGGRRASGPGEGGGWRGPREASSTVSRRQSTTFLRFSPRGRAPAAAPDATAAAAAAFPLLFFSWLCGR